MRLFPQKEQTSMVLSDPPVHIAPFSMVHVELHPSPSIVLPSSHSSEECLRESPHLASQPFLRALTEVPPVHSDQISPES